MIGTAVRLDDEVKRKMMVGGRAKVAVGTILERIDQRGPAGLIGSNEVGLADPYDSVHASVRRDAVRFRFKISGE